MSITVIYPRLSDIIPLESIPDGLEGVREALQDVFDDLYVKNFFTNRSPDGSSGYYSLKIVSFEGIGLNLPFMGGNDEMKLLINPTVSGASEIAVTFDYSWQIIKYINSFSFTSFDNSLRTIVGIFYEVAQITPEDLLRNVIVAFIPQADAMEQLVNKLNADYNTGIVLVPGESEEQQLQNILAALLSYNLDLIQVITESFIENVSFADGISRIRQLFSNILDDAQENLNQIIKLNFTAQLSQLSLGLQFPRKWLQPVYDGSQVVVDGNGNPVSLNINDPLPEGYYSYLTFDVGQLIYSTNFGFRFYKETDFNLNRSMIGTTGLILEFEGLKVDLSTDNNIPEATFDGRPDNFRGVYAERAVITLPEKWFKDDDLNPSTAQIVAKDILVGSGGLSGTILLEATGGDGIIWKKIGSSDGFRVGFNSFDIVFSQNRVTGSSLTGALELSKLTYPLDHPLHNTPIKIDIKGHIDDNGGFELTATTQPFPVTFPDVFTYDLKTVVLGREGEGPFYIGTSGTLQFEGFLKDVLHLGPIEIQSLKIYSDGSMEFSGGGINLLEPVVLTLGPVDITVSAIHYGSHQKEVDSVIRKFNYFGFDGGLNVDPLGIEIRGDGIKFYYCTDDLEPKLDPYVHIQTIYLDLTLPAKAPAAIINGWLSIPEPGISQEYAGGLKLQLPKVGITGSVDMKLMPRYPAFILDAEIEFPAPIPIGAFALYGFRGLLGYRYVAAKEAVGLTGTNSWYEYYKKPPRGIHVQKFYGPNDTADFPDPFSIGAGASLGTSFDGGTVLNLKVMFLLSTPSVFMLDGRAGILSARLGLEDTKDPPFFAVATIGPDSLEFGFGADFKLPSGSGSMLKLYADMQAAFFFNNSSNWFVHFGTKEHPTMATILSLVELKSYLMLSAKGIEAGAFGELDFKRTYAGVIKVNAWAYIEIGGRVSFERPQFGAYLDAGVGADIKVGCFNLSATFDILFAVEASEPFLIYGRVRLTVSIDAWLFSFSFDAMVDVMWEKSKYVNRKPINPLTTATDTEVIEQLVKGVNMLSNEMFDLCYLGSINLPSTADPQTLNPEILKHIIPLDTYIDIKTQKGLLLEGNVASLIGGVASPPKKFTDLIPPNKVIKGKELRQVTHRYAISDIQLKFWRPAGPGVAKGWMDYHPYKALYPNDGSPEFNNLKIGQFQKTDGQYNTIRLLATTPFSYTEQGEPGWYIPEQYGMTAADFFCEGDELSFVCADFLEKPLGQQYFCEDQNDMFYSREAAFLLLDSALEEYAEVTDFPNIFAFDQSLAFDIRHRLQIILPEPSVAVNLKLTSDSQAVRIRYYAPMIDDLALEVQHGHPNPAAVNQTIAHTIIVNAANLDQVVEYSKPEWRAITKIIIEPVYGNKAAIKKVVDSIGAINIANLQSALGLYPLAYQPPIPPMNLLDSLVDFGGTLRSRSYTYDFTNNRYLDKDQLWYQSWDIATGKKTAGNPIGFLLSGNTIYIESDNQLIDAQLLPEKSSEIQFESEGYSAIINVYDIKDYLTPEGYLQISLDLYQNCKNDKRLCTLSQGLTAIGRNFIEPSIATAGDLPLIRKAMVRFRSLVTAFDGKYPDYKLTATLSVPLKDVDSFISKGDMATYPLGYAGAESIKNTVLSDGNCSCNNGCQADPVLCALYKLLSELMISCILDPRVVKVSDLAVIKGCVETFLAALADFEAHNPSYELYKKFGAEINAIKRFTEAVTLSEYVSAHAALLSILRHLDDLGDCNCGNNANALEELYDAIKDIVGDHFSDIEGTDFTEQLEYAELILDMIREFNDRYPGLDLPANLNDQIHIIQDFLNNPGAASLDKAIDAIQDVLDHLNDLSGGRFDKMPKRTLLHEVCWLSLESYIYNQNIPQQEAISLDVGATVAGITKYIQPIWRPNTSYLLHFKLRDLVDDGELESPHEFKFTYGFTTAGPVGYFHTDPASTYGDMLVKPGEKVGDFIAGELSILDDPNGKLRYYDDGAPYPSAVDDLITPHPDKWALTSLKQYIDYGRSYPNADGNLLSSKPLFYDDDQVSQIFLFFNKAYATHFFHNWIDYQMAGSRAGRIKIVIKDPAENDNIVNPPYLDYDPQDTETLNTPQTVESWETDEHPLMPFVISQWANLFNTPGNCVISGGLPIKPASSYSIVKLKNLKPLKLYTAIVNNLYDMNGDGTFDELTEMREVHRFVFQTSRYANFAEQVGSYMLSDNGENPAQRQAIFNLEMELVAGQIDNMLNTITGNPNPADDLIPLYQHAYDRVVEGILGMSPLDVPISTEFNIVRNTADNGKIVAVIIRNPEPFNIPAIPVGEAGDTIRIFTDGIHDTAYKLLHSKDYSQCVIMHSSKAMTVSSLDIRFRFKMWNGFSYEPLVDIDPVVIAL